MYVIPVPLTTGHSTFNSVPDIIVTVGVAGAVDSVVTCIVCDTLVPY